MKPISHKHVPSKIWFWIGLCTCLENCIAFNDNKLFVLQGGKQKVQQIHMLIRFTADHLDMHVSLGQIFASFCRPLVANAGAMEMTQNFLISSHFYLVSLLSD